MSGDRRIRRAFVLQGHASRLPGKFDLPFGEETLIGRVFRILRAAGLRTELISVHRGDSARPPAHFDPYDEGPLGALAVARSITEEPFLLVGGDMPGVSVPAVRSIGSEFRGTTLVPREPDGTLEVLFGAYARFSHDELEPWIRRSAGLHAFVRNLHRRHRAEFVPATRFPPETFRDVDTEEDYRRALTALLPAATLRVTRARARRARDPR